MSVLTLAVFSGSVDYVNRFLAFFRSYRSDMFETIGFTEASALKSCLSAGRIDILLVSQENIHDLNICANVSLGKEDNSIGNSINLDVVKELVILGEHQNLSASPKEINIYRSMSAICKDIEKIASSIIPEGQVRERDVVIKGIFNLDGSCDPFQSASCLLPERGRTIFVDLDRFSALPSSVRPGHSHSLSDLLFLYKSGAEEFPSMVGETVWDYQGMDIISFPVTPFDLDEIRSFEWADFLSAIAAAGRYSCMIISMTDSVRDIFGIFSACNAIYVICRDFEFIKEPSLSSLQGSYSSKRAAAYGRYFEDNNFDSLISLMEKAPVPAPVIPEEIPTRRKLFQRKE